MVFEPLKPPRYAVDIETRSTEDLTVVGLYKYAENENTYISLIGVTDLVTGDKIVTSNLEEVAVPLGAIASGKECMVAHNSRFDATMLYYKYFKPVLGAPPEAVFQAWDTQDFVKIRNELPSKSGFIKLANAAEFYCSQPKDLEGGALTKLVCQIYPDEGSCVSALKKVQKIVPSATIEKVDSGWEIRGTEEREKEYCEIDVALVVELFKKLSYTDEDNNFILKSYAATHREEQYLTNQMNFYGVSMDMELLQKIKERGEAYKAAAVDAHVEITGFTPTQSARNIGWLSERLTPHGVPKTKSKTTGKMNHYTGSDALNSHIMHLGDKDPELSAQMFKMMTLKNNTWKRVEKALASVDTNHRLRGSLNHYGAQSTGRWTSAGFQLQNIPRPVMSKEKLDEYLTKPIPENDFSLSCDIIKSALRPCVVAPKGKNFFISDYAQIELRMSLDLTGQFEELQKLVYEDLYIDYATVIYPRVEIKKKGDERQFAKSVILAGQYGASEACLLLSYIADKGKLPDVDMGMVHSKFHSRFPAFKVHHKKYSDMLNAALPSGRLVVPLRSGRCLIYDNLTVEYEECPFTGHVRKIIKSNGRKIYGPMIFQNVCQAESKDILAIKAIEFYKENKECLPAFLVHDENVAEVDDSIPLAELEAKWNAAGSKRIQEIWPDFLLDSESHLSKYYYKF